MGADRNDQKNERVEGCCSEAWDLLQSISLCFGTFTRINIDFHRTLLIRERVEKNGWLQGPR